MQFAHCPVCGFQVFETPRHHRDWEFVVICSCCKTHYALDDINIMMSWADLTTLPSAERQVLYRRAWAQLRAQ